MKSNATFGVGVIHFVLTRFVRVRLIPKKTDALFAPVRFGGVNADITTESMPVIAVTAERGSLQIWNATGR